VAPDTLAQLEAVEAVETKAGYMLVACNCQPVAEEVQAPHMAKACNCRQTQKETWLEQCKDLCGVVDKYSFRLYCQPWSTSCIFQIFFLIFKTSTAPV